MSLDTQQFVAGARELGVVPHPALNAGQKTLRVMLTSAHAILDRFLHHAQVIAITGKSYRLQNAALAAPTRQNEEQK